ncbi:MAG: GTPase HflX [Capsulimonadaceae bacterium]|nr:GTPase HflX [Capsulimonadaceae bacterium]
MPSSDYFDSSGNERAIIVSLSLSGGEDDSEMRIDEMRELASTAGASVIAECRQSRRSPDSSTYIGTGKAAEIAGQVKVLRPDLVIFDDELSPTQQRNLVEIMGAPVVDRTQLILDIFAQRARTHEGRLQVELAQLTYLLPRLSAQYTKFERQQGGIGGRGPGETKLEHDRRKVRERIADLSHEIDEIKEQRGQQRRMRRELPFPSSALVGYTSAGKSTLLNLLSGAEVFADARLFATLDPTTRRVILPDGWSVLMTDTVGFMRHLPHDLIAAFRATLEEVVQADFLIHVVDVSHVEYERQMAAVEEVLADLGVTGKPVVTVFNKIDCLADTYPVRALVAATPNSCSISATRHQGISDLMERISLTIADLLVNIEAAIPYDRSELIPQCYESGKVHSLDYQVDGIFVKASVTRDLAGRMEPYVLNRDINFYKQLEEKDGLAS